MSPRDNVVASFRDDLGRLLRDHRDLMQNVATWHRKVALESTLCSQFAHDVMVRWQLFLHRLLIAYIQMDPTRMVRQARVRYQQSVDDKLGKPVGRLARLKIPKRLTWSLASTLLDPKNLNVAPSTAKELSDLASNFLAPPFAMRLALEKNDASFYDFATALRNHLSHLSTASRKRLSAAVQKLEGTQFMGYVDTSYGQPGRYLRQAHSTSGHCRAVMLAKHLMDLASRL